MANDEKPGTNLASGSVIVVALVASAGAFLFHRDAPLHGSRPAITEASIHERAETQTVDARLWQDPFAAVAKAIDKLAKDERGQQCRNKLSDDKTCSSPLVTEDLEENSEKNFNQHKDALVIAVTMSAAPYSEDSEQRRRTRYAVLSGLERAGFVPRDARHLGYFWLTQGPTIPTPPAPLRPALSHLLQIYPKWSAGNWPAARPVVPKPLLFRLSPLVEQQRPDRSKLAVAFPQSQPPLVVLSDLLKSYESGQDSHETRIGLAQSIPYEWFEEASQNLSAESDRTRDILVLWLEEESLKHHPLWKITELKTFLHVQKDQNLKIIGPYTSGILRDLVREACAFDENNKCDQPSTKVGPSFLKDVQFYPYGASAPNAQLLGKAGDETVERYFEKAHIQLQRTIGTDDTLAKGIKEELELRNAKIGANFKQGNGDLALISEWDTFYGQTLPKAVEAQFNNNTCEDGTICFIHKLTYLRGLDGLTPMTGEAEERKQDKPTPQKQAGAAGFFKTQTDANNLDRPVGQGQFDYLRRMSKDLHKTDEELQKNHRRIKAIGILGSDVFDKLLILRALRPEFPEALFFTTDFDEAYTIESELPWTRNLLIASSFGSRLNDKIQGEIPAFRNSYQTSAFLATLSAIGNPHRNWVTPKLISDVIDEQLLIPRIFEISRSGDALAFKVNKNSIPASSPKNPEQKQEECPGCKDKIAADGPTIQGRSEASGGGQDSTKDCDKSPNGWYCEAIQIQPDVKELFPTFERISRIYLACGLAGGAFLGLALLCLGKVPKGVRVEVWLVVTGLGVGALTSAFWEPFAQFVTVYGRGEPIALLEGISVWPTVLLRVLGIILAFYFIWRAQNSLCNNLVKIADEMKLPTSDEATPGSRDRLRFWIKLSYFMYTFFMYTLWDKLVSACRDKHTLRKKIAGVIRYIRETIASIFDFSLGQDDKKQNASFKVEVAWNAYVCQERFWSRRSWRAAFYTLLMFGFFRYVLSPMLGHPITPARGDFAATAYFISTRLDVILMLFLTFFVFDATCFCLLFVNKLRRAKTEWPDKTREDFKRRLRLQTELIHDWIDLEFVAKRTRCIGWLIYYPFVLIALLILSRTMVFANYAPSPTILVAQGISLSVVFGCAIMLWWAATAARDAAKQNLTDEIIWAKGPGVLVCVIDTAPPHTVSHANVGDAAQPVLPRSHPDKPKEASANQPQQPKDLENPRYAEQLETLLSRVEQLRDGAFGPFTQQPLVRAVILPMGSFGWTALLENGMLPGL